MDEFRGRRVSVIGAARSGIAAAGALIRLGADAWLSDSKPAGALSAEQRAQIAATGARFISGAGVADALPEGTDLVVTSPGVPKTAAVLQEAVRRGIPVWSEIELACRLTDSPILAVTGTNGKTTTTLLIAAMLRASGREAVVAGNISADAIKKTLVEAALPSPPDPLLQGQLGLAIHAAGEGERQSPNSPPLPQRGRGGREVRAERAGKGSGGSGEAGRVLVAEISSFQLEWVERFAPKVGVLTNITPDHLNRHADFEEYAQTKARLFAAQGPDDWAVLNYDDPSVRALGARGLAARRVWFTLQGQPPDDGPAAWSCPGREGEELVIRVRTHRQSRTVLRVSDLSPALPGRHSIANVLAAGAASLAMGATPEGVAQAVAAFRGVAHRMEFVAEVDGVRYINNSMCTNVAAAAASLSAMDRPTVVIAGGADKALDFAPLAPTLRDKAKHLILIGTAADKMEATFRAGGYDAITRAERLEEAVQQARRRAGPGDAVLLSPACASFDMFSDFEARGEAFRLAVRALGAGAS